MRRSDAIQKPVALLSAPLQDLTTSHNVGQVCGKARLGSNSDTCCGQVWIFAMPGVLRSKIWSGCDLFDGCRGPSVVQFFQCEECVRCVQLLVVLSNACCIEFCGIKTVCRMLTFDHLCFIHAAKMSPCQSTCLQHIVTVQMCI